MKRNRATRAGAVVAAFVFAVFLLARAALPASAEPTAPLASEPSAIQAERTGELVLHKHLAPALDQSAYPADGTPLELPGTAAPLPGVVFTVARVEGVDLTTAAGWDRARAYQHDLAGARAHLGATVTSEPTAADGSTTLSGLPLGLYLVRESVAYAPDGTEDPSVRRAGDFLVTLPMADPRNPATWLYTVHVYPKNERLGLTKSVADGNAGVAGQDAATIGGILTYTLTADIPSGGLRAFGGRCMLGGSLDRRPGHDAAGFTADGVCAPDAQYAGAAYRIVDDLAAAQVPGSDRHTSDYLEFAAPDWTGVVTASLTTAPAPLTPCVEGAVDCDYRVALTASTLTLDLTDRGLVALQQAIAASGEARLAVTAQARVRPGAAGQDSPLTAALLPGGPTAPVKDCVLVLPNRAALIPGSWATGSPIPSNAVVSKYATLTLHKVDQRTGASLAGAVFTLYRTRDDAEHDRAPLAVSAPTDGSGITRFPALHVTQFQNGGADDDRYWAVETTAPQGYRGVKAPIELGLNANGSTLHADGSLGQPVPNRKNGDWWMGLPDTGALGEGNHLLALGLIGAALILALVAFLRHRQTRKGPAGA